jgi:translation initiation factor 1 (eIF-1/SUI1)
VAVVVVDAVGCEELVIWAEAEGEEMAVEGEQAVKIRTEANIRTKTKYVVFIHSAPVSYLRLHRFRY